MLSGPAEIELVSQAPTVLGARFAKVSLPIGNAKIVFPATREVADAVQKILSLEIVDYAE